MENPGIAARRDGSGAVRYRVRVRRHGHTYAGTFATPAEARLFRAQALAAADGLAEAPAAPTPPPPPAQPPGRAVTVEDAARRLCRGMLDGTIRTRQGRPYKPSVLRKYEEQLRLLVVPRIGAVPVTTLTGGDCQRLVDEIAAERTPEHARKALTALRVALRVCQRYGEIETNTCAGVRVPTSADGEKPARILTPEEATAIVDQADADDARLGRSFGGPLVALAFGSGLRLGELLALRWGPNGLDVDAGVVRVRASLDRVRDASGAYPEHPPKSRASRRDVPLAAEDIAWCRRHRLATGRRDGELVFGSDDGEHLSPVPAHRGFRRACFRAGVFAGGVPDELRALRSYAAFQRRCRELGVVEPLPRFHDTRHAFATHMLAAGLTAHAVAALLGHTDAGLVQRRYGHALPDELAQAGARLSAWRAALSEGAAASTGYRSLALPARGRRMGSRAFTEPPRRFR